MKKVSNKAKLKYISGGDLKSFYDILKKFKNDRESVARILHNQLITPKVNIQDFCKITDSQLISLAEKLIRKEKHVFHDFKKTTEIEFFANFRKSLEKYFERRTIQLSATLKPIIDYSTKAYKNFNLNYQNLFTHKIFPYNNIMGSLNQIAKFAEQAKKTQWSILEALKPKMDLYKSHAQFISQILKPQIDVWQGWVKQHKILFDTYRNLWQKLQIEYKLKEKRALAVLRKYKWFITLSLPLHFIYEAVKVGSKKGNQRAVMNKLFVDYFMSDDCQNLAYLIESWKANPLFKPRMKIFRDCVSLLKGAKRSNNPSLLLLPTLIAQIDGIQTEFMKKKGLNLDLRRMKWKDSTGEEINKKRWFEDLTSNEDLLSLANDIFFNILFQKSQPGRPLKTPFTFNRHKILHGEYLKYGRIDNTIRAFLILDFLATLK